MGKIPRVLVSVVTVLVAGAAAAEALTPAWLIQLPETVPTVFVAITDAAEFHRYDRVDDGVALSASYYVSIGRNGAGKERAGDRRTPIGTYFVTEQIDTTRLHEKYGAMAFPLDYPNEWDRRLERSGDGIWVHGVDPRGGKRPVRDTDGCLALPNADLISLEPVFEPGRTPVLVSRSLRLISQDERRQIAAQLRESVAAWADSIASGDLYVLLSLYDKGFRRWSMDYVDWGAHLAHTLPGRPISGVDVEELLLLGYPGEEGLYLSRFRQRTTEGDKITEATTRLYWRRDEHGAFRIVAQDSG